MHRKFWLVLFLCHCSNNDDIDREFILREIENKEVFVKKYQKLSKEESFYNKEIDEENMTQIKKKLDIENQKQEITKKGNDLDSKNKERAKIETTNNTLNTKNSEMRNKIYDWKKGSNEDYNKKKENLKKQAAFLQQEKERLEAKS